MEITFHDRQLGFSVIMNSHGRNAIVSQITDRNLTDLGLVIGLRLVEIQCINVEDWQHRKILDTIQTQQTRPLFIVFKRVELCICYNVLNCVGNVTRLINYS